MKQQISHSGLILLTTFSPDGNSVMSVGDEKKALIYTHGSNGKWELKATIEHDCRIVSANFSPDSNHVVTASKDGIVKTSGWYSNGKWQEKAIYKHDDYLIKSAIFINHGRHVMITDDNKSIGILYLSLKK